MAEETTTMVFRIEKDLKTAFERAAKDLDITPSQLIRHHIKRFVEGHMKENAQKDLLKPSEAVKPFTKAVPSPKRQKSLPEGKNGLLGIFKKV